MCRQLSDTASRLVEVMVDVNVMAVDWLANFSDYGVTTKLRELQTCKISFQNLDTTFLRQSHDIVTIYDRYDDEVTKILGLFYDVL